MPTQRAAILSCGNELLLGRIADTNAQWIASHLSAQGIEVDEICAVGDRLDGLCTTLKRLCEGHSLLIVTGGLGPTQDDLTRQALSNASGRPLVLSPELLKQVQARFESIQRPMAPINEVQAMIPKGAEGIPNPNGTAPGIALTVGETRIFALPGVPSEMKAMLADAVLPAITASESRPTAVLKSRELQLWGIGEGSIGTALNDLMVPGRQPSVGTMVNNMIITVRILASAESPEKADRLLDSDEKTIRERLGPHIFGGGGDSLSGAVVHELQKQGATLSLAESCTGGLIGKLITDIDGSSQVFPEGFVTYSNRAKQERLQVPGELLETHGAVSQEVAEAMAAGVRAAAGTDYGIGVTGIAGPGGGTEAKPVGLVHVAVHGPAGSLHIENRYAMGRDENRLRSANTALGLLLRMLRFGIDPLP
ncbi:MAG: competence/damage-inducible protein A [Planctomycetota bacterium]|jgi:nicotinamide-nucleotide amidase